MNTEPAIPLDDLPRPGVAISRDRWLQLIAAEAELAELRKDKARLDWLETQPSFAVWSGFWSSITDRAGQAVYDLHDLGDAEGQLGDQWGQGGTIRAAIDAAIAQRDANG